MAAFLLAFLAVLEFFLPIVSTLVPIAARRPSPRDSATSCCVIDRRQKETSQEVEENVKSNPQMITEIEKHTGISLSKQVEMLGDRNLRSDVILGVTEGVIFEVCKVIVDATSSVTGIHVSHALNSKQDDISYLLRGLLQEITLNAIIPALGVTTRTSNPTKLQSKSPDQDSSLMSLYSHDSDTEPVNLPLSVGTFDQTGPKLASIKFSLHVDLPSLYQDESTAASGDAATLDWETSHSAFADRNSNQVTPPRKHPFFRSQARNHGQGFASDLISSSDARTNIQTNPTSDDTRMKPSYSTQLKSNPSSIDTKISDNNILSRAREVVRDAKLRRSRIATIVILRSFVAPLLLHSFGHIFPSFVSLEILQDVEKLVAGDDADGALGQ